MGDSIITERLLALENEVKYLKMCKESDTLDNKGKKETKGKKDKKPREPTEYNKFVKSYIEEKKKEGSDFKHKDLFKEAAAKWKEHKKLTESKE